MKKYYLLLIIFAAFFSRDMNAQGFTYTNLGTNYIQVPYIQDSLQDIHMQAIVKNTSSTTLHFRFARIYNTLALDWSTQMCYDLCYAPQVDTISLTSDPPYSIAPGHEDTLFYISFVGESQSLGKSIVRMYNTDNPSLYVQDTFTVQIGSVGITNISSVVENYNLAQNYPNPFNPTTNIIFSIPKSQSVSLKVYDILGNQVADLINNENLTAGKYKIDFVGNSLASGIYYYTLKTENFVDTKKMILLK